MSILDKHAIVCLESIKDSRQRTDLINKLSEFHSIIDISYEEMGQFCGNVIMGENSLNEKHVLLSERAFNGFSEENRKELQRHYELTYSNVDTIETIGGGGVRCMLAELFY